MLIAIMAGIGAAVAVDRLRAAVAGGQARRHTVRWIAISGVWVLLLGGVAWHGQAIYSEMDRSGDDSSEVFWREIRGWEGTPEALEQDAFLIGSWTRRNELIYLQSVHGWRRDLRPVVLDDIVAGNRLHLIDEWLIQGRPIYLLEGASGMLDHFDAEQRGSIWRITARR
jgi:hypothetical protein